MTYNFKKIGKRIEENRKQLGLKSADSLSEAIEEQGAYYSRQLIRVWERGEDVPPEKALLIMCNLFQCDLGYLLGEYDCKTRTNTDIAEETGLSDTAIECLKEMNDESKTVLNFLLEDEALWVLLENMSKFENAYKNYIAALQNQLDNLEDEDAAINQAKTYVISDAAKGRMKEYCEDMVIRNWTDHVHSKYKATISEDKRREHSAKSKQILHAQLQEK